MQEEQKMKEVLDSLLSSIDKEDAELYRPILENNRHIEKLVDRKHEGFYFGFVYPYDKFLKQLIAHKWGAECFHLDKLKFLFIHSSYVEQHYLQLIQKYEGGSCSADKSHCIMRKLSQFFHDNQVTEWDYEQEYTYQLPKKIFTTHESIITFFDAIRSLYYGRMEKYMKWIEINLLPLNK